MIERYILIVEASFREAQVIKKAIQKDVYKITAVECGEDALSLLTRQKVEVIIVDKFHCDRNGFSFIARATGQNSCVQVILVAESELSDADIQKARKLGAFQVIKKMKDITLLRQTVEDALKTYDQKEMLQKSNGHKNAKAKVPEKSKWSEEEIQDRCRKKMGEMFFKPPENKMMKAFSEAIFEDMIKRSLL